MSLNSRISPVYGSGVVVSAAAASANTAVLKTAKQISVTNLGTTNVGYFRCGQGSGTVATTADMPVMPGRTVIVTKGEGLDYVAYISASGTSLHIIAGEGF